MGDHHVRLDVPEKKKDSLSVPAVNVPDKKKSSKKEDVLKNATQVEEEGDSDSEGLGGEPDEPVKVTKDRKSRAKYEYALLKKVKELSAVQERLYYVRHDKTRSPTDQKLELTNLAREYARIKMTLEVLLQKSASSFEDSLALQEVGLPKHLDNETYKPTVNVSLEATISNIKLSDDLVLDELESQKFMRTKSTQTLKDKAPKAKWDGMMSMFKEWKHHNTVAEGQQVLARKPSTDAKTNEAVIVHHSEDLVALRQAIYQLKQRKNLSKNDQALLKKMQQKLADMTGAATGPV